MKKLLLAIMVAVLAAAATSCDVSKEAKIKTLVGEYVQNHLFIPDSYDPVEFMIDSAFTPRLDPEFWEFIIDISDDFRGFDSELLYCDTRISHAENLMDMYKDSKDDDGRRTYIDAKVELETYTAEKNKIKKRISDIKAEIIHWTEEPKFIGYLVELRYRAFNNDFRPSFGRLSCIIDKDANYIIATYDRESDDYKKYENFIKQINRGAIDLLYD